MYCFTFSASEMREWLLHFSVPVLENLLAPEPYLHFILLVSGISTLVRDDLKKIDVDYAESCLIDFCKIYPKIYGNLLYKIIMEKIVLNYVLPVMYVGLTIKTTSFYMYCKRNSCRYILVTQRG